MGTLFSRAEVTSAYLKMGIMGFAGSGKTFTATEAAIGLVQHMRGLKLAAAERPVFFLDTETGSDWVKPRFDAAGIELFTAKTRAFRDLMAAVNEAEKSSSLLLIDSISHFWMELCDAYMRQKKRTRLQFEDWAYLKREWRQFTDLFVNSGVHIVLCGRAGYEYDYFEDEAGKKQLEKTDIKMKAESEMGYEPSLLVLMERSTDLETMKAYRTATILKDRACAIDGKQFRNPKFENFMPHIAFLNLGGRQLGVDTTRNSDSMIPADQRDSGRVQRKIVLDEIESILVLHFPGQTANEKKTKVALLRKHFKASWTEMEEVMPLFDLRAGYDSLHQELEGEPSRYGAALSARAAPAAEPDSIPDFPTNPEKEAPNEHVGSTPQLLAEPRPTESVPVGADPFDIPPEFDRRKKVAKFDADAWIAQLNAAFNGCEDMIGLGQAVESTMTPRKTEASAEAWKRAEALMQEHVRRINQVAMEAG